MDTEVADFLDDRVSAKGVFYVPSQKQTKLQIPLQEFLSVPRWFSDVEKVCQENNTKFGRAQRKDPHVFLYDSANLVETFLMFDNLRVVLQGEVDFKPNGEGEYFLGFHATQAGNDNMIYVPPLLKEVLQEQSPEESLTKATMRVVPDVPYKDARFVYMNAQHKANAQARLAEERAMGKHVIEEDTEWNLRFIIRDIFFSLSQLLLLDFIKFQHLDPSSPKNKLNFIQRGTILDLVLPYLKKSQ